MVFSGGINFANTRELSQDGYGGLLTLFRTRSRPCVFLSHKREDKEEIIELGNLINNIGIDIYLDIYDEELAIASDSNNHEAITRALEEGLKKSTHILCCMSEKTRESMWVPYELGYGKRSEKPIATILLKDFRNKEDVPSYLKVAPTVRGKAEFEKYLIDLLKLRGLEFFESRGEIEGHLKSVMNNSRELLDSRY